MLKLKNIIKFSIVLISFCLISSVETLANVSTPGYYINTYNAGIITFKQLQAGCLSISLK